jgi:hypothetical protein
MLRSTGAQEPPADKVLVEQAHDFGARRGLRQGNGVASRDLTQQTERALLDASLELHKKKQNDLTGATVDSDFRKV